jgi:hypothetical protein
MRVHQPDWLRGPARLEGEWVVLDDSKAEQYQPLSEADLLFDLADLRRPDDAIAFARRYGLLRHGLDATTFREPFADWLEAAYTLANLLGLYRLIRAAMDGDDEASQTLWEVWEPRLRPALEPPPQTDSELLIGASQALAAFVSDGLRGVELRINSDVEWGVGPDNGPGRPDGFRLAPQPPDLLGLAYFALAMLINLRAPLAACEDCGRHFSPSDPRQRFCTTTCAARTRRRRWRERHVEDSEP